MELANRGPTGTLSSASSPSLRDSLGPLLLVSLAMLVGFTMLQSFGIMAQSAKVEMGLTDTDLAIVQGVSAAIPLVLFSIPIGMWVDRWNRVFILIIMAIGWTLGTFLTAAASSTPILFLGRMLVAIGTTGGLTAVLSLASDYCPPQQRGRALVVPNIAKTAGVAAGFTVAGVLLGAIAGKSFPTLFAVSDWRNAQMSLGVASAILILPLLLLREPQRREREAAPGAPTRVLLRELMARRKWIIPLFVGQTSVVMADAAAAIWISPVLERDYGMMPAQFAGWVGAIVLVTGIAGSIVGGIVADAGQSSKIRGGLLIGAIVAAAIGVPSALFPIMPGVGSLATAFFALSFAGNVTGMVASVVLTVWLPNELRGLGIGAFIAVAGLIGFGLAPALVTLVSSGLGGEQHLAEALAMVGVSVSLVSVIAFWLAMRGAPATSATKEK